MLQWGRNFIVAEIDDDCFITMDGKVLQWGRNFIVAEIGIGSREALDQARASMGPQLYRCGNML